MEQQRFTLGLEIEEKDSIEISQESELNQERFKVRIFIRIGRMIKYSFGFQKNKAFKLICLTKTH